MTKIIQIAVGGEYKSVVYGLADNGAVYCNTYRRDGTRGWKLLIAANELTAEQGEP